MRIIGGDYKGKKLVLPNDKKTRPLKDLVKESIFNLIHHSKKINLDIRNSLILDLFSGSGSFGLECISRGAKKVTFVENYSEAIKILKRNVSLIKNSDKYEIINENIFYLFENINKYKFKTDIIFLDPPFKEKKLNELINKILKSNILNKNGLIIAHRHKKDNLEITKNLNIIDERSYGISKIIIGN